MARGDILVSICFALAGCVNAEAPVAEEPEALEAQGERPHRGRHHRPGRGARLLEVALADVDLRAEQREKIEDLLARDETDGDGRHEHVVAIVAAVRAGDVAALERVSQEKERRRAEHVGRIVTVLDELHATLDANQRAQLVGAIRARFEHHGDRPGRGRGHGREHRGFDRGHGRGPERMLEELELTGEQRARLDAVRQEAQATEDPRADHEERRAHHEALLAAFERDDFQASTLGIGDHMGRHGGGHIAHLVVLVPILTEEQREVLADRMEERFE